MTYPLVLRDAQPGHAAACHAMHHLQRQWHCACIPLGCKDLLSSGTCQHFAQSDTDSLEGFPSHSVS